MDGSSMNQALYETESPQGEITGKGFPDHDEFSERRDNATNSRAIQMCYPGGENPQNLHIIPGELSIGRRDGNLYATNGEPNERGFTSLSGFYWGRFRSLEAAMRYHYFQGVAKTEYMIDSVEQGEGGYTYLRAGSCSIINNGPGDIFAGDLVQWRFPDTYKTLRTQPDDRQPAGTEPDIVYGNRAGTPMTKVLVEVVRFDPADFSTCLAAAWDVMERKSTGAGQVNNGILGLTFSELYRKIGMTDAKNLDSLQEEALGLQNSLLAIGVILAKHMTLNRGIDFGAGGPSVSDIFQGLGLYDATGRGTDNVAKLTLRKTVLGVLFRPYITGDARAAANTTLYNILGLAGDETEQKRKFLAATRNRNTSDPDSLAIQLAADPLGMLLGAISSAQHARYSRIIGKAMSSASKSDTLHIMIGHFRNC